jgi:hypothetical protein
MLAVCDVTVTKLYLLSGIAYSGADVSVAGNIWVWSTKVSDRELLGFTRKAVGLVSSEASGGVVGKTLCFSMDVLSSFFAVSTLKSCVGTNRIPGMGTVVVDNKILLEIDTGTSEVSIWWTGIVLVLFSMLSSNAKSWLFWSNALLAACGICVVLALVVVFSEKAASVVWVLVVSGLA